MTDPIRDLLISLASHMAYMQGQLEARHGLDDFEDFYWYRESVLLRHKVTDVLADEPAVPEGREPVAVTEQPSAAELLQRQALVPVSVSDGWPEFSDCNDVDCVWCWNWAIGTWRLNRIDRSIHSHWLPAHALPLPEVK